MPRAMSATARMSQIHTLEVARVATVGTEATSGAGEFASIRLV
jgi:hypothetical protein